MQPKKIDCTEKNLHTFIDKASGFAIARFFLPSCRLRFWRQYCRRLAIRASSGQLLLALLVAASVPSPAARAPSSSWQTRWQTPFFSICAIYTIHITVIYNLTRIGKSLSSLSSCSENGLTERFAAWQSAWQSRWQTWQSRWQAWQSPWQTWQSPWQLDNVADKLDKLADKLDNLLDKLVWWILYLA